MPHVKAYTLVILPMLHCAILLQVIHSCFPVACNAYVSFESLLSSSGYESVFFTGFNLGSSFVCEVDM